MQYKIHIGTNKLGYPTTIRLFQGQRKTLQELAEKEGLKEADLIRRGVYLYLQNYK